MATFLTLKTAAHTSGVEFPSGFKPTLLLTLTVLESNSLIRKIGSEEVLFWLRTGRQIRQWIRGSVSYCFLVNPGMRLFSRLFTSQSLAGECNNVWILAVLYMV